MHSGASQEGLRLRVDGQHLQIPLRRLRLLPVAPSSRVRQSWWSLGHAGVKDFSSEEWPKPLLLFGAVYVLYPGDLGSGDALLVGGYCEGCSRKGAVRAETFVEVRNNE